MEEDVIQKIRADIPKNTQSGTRLTDDVCPVCHGNGWELFTVSARELEYVYGDAAVDTEYARRCTACMGINKSSGDTTGCPDSFREADIYKFDFDCYEADMAKRKAIILNFFDKYNEWVKKGKGLYIFSKTAGSGKTFLSCCIGKSVMMRYGLRFKFITVPDYIDKVSEGYTLAKQGIPNSPADIYKECDLLVLDDIGTQLDKPWQNQELFKLVNERVNSGLITIYTSNLPIDKLNIDERVKSRIYGTSILLPMPEESIRSRKANESQDDFLRSIL